MRIRNVLLLASTLVLVGCNDPKEEPTVEPSPTPDPTEKYNDFQKLVYRSLAEGILKEGSFKMDFRGSNLDENGNEISFNTEESSYIMKDNMLLISGKTGPERVINIKDEKVYRYNKDEDKYYFAEGIKPQQVSNYSTTFNYAIEDTLELTLDYYHDEYLSVVDDTKYKYERTIEYGEILQFTHSLHGDVEMIDSYDTTFYYTETRKMHYHVTIDSYSVTWPNITLVE